jgi:hypothetical protein
MIASRCEIDSELRDFLASLPPGTVIAQLADGSLAICGSEDEADQKVLTSWEEQKTGKTNEPRARALPPRRRSLAGGRVSKTPRMV